MFPGKEVEVTISSAKDIKNVNWRNGPNQPYAVVWVDPDFKRSTEVDKEGDTCPNWNEKLNVPLPANKPVDDEDNVLFVDIVHAGQEEDTKPVIGSARVNLRDVVKEAGTGIPVSKTLILRRPSGRPQGRVELTVTVREPKYPSPHEGYPAPPYGTSHPPPYGYDPSYPPPPVHGAPYGSQPYNGPYGSQPYGAPAQGYPYNAAPAHGQPSYQYPVEKKKSGLGLGAGIAIGAAAGLLGGLAISEGIDAIEDHIAEEVEEKLQEEEDYF